jgi:anti-sigma regulatory factor (Ser/Thr protein kinase)
MTKIQKRTEEIRQFILEKLEDHPSDITSVVSAEFDISRQASHKHIQKLISKGLVVASGKTKNRTYEPKPLVDFTIELSLDNLEEDKVWREHIRPLMNNLPRNVFDICHYGLTEMVNNVIDHSEGTELGIVVRRLYNDIELVVVDNGVGIFSKIQREFELDDPLHAILELSKGKLTSNPSRHTGEGIFFTSRMFDTFNIGSGKLMFWRIEGRDILIENRESVLNGTGITMSVNIKSERTTQNVFDSYSVDGDFGFSKTHVPVFLAAYGEETLISRSQAKRLLAHFEKFKEIILDFKDVDAIGQAFADEIFRVFQNQHPDIHLIIIRANEQVQKMIAHVTGGK